MFQHKQFNSFVRRDVPLAMYTRLQLGGAAEFFAEPVSEEELFALLKHCRAENVPVRIIGSGSNVLVSEDGVSGVVLSLAAPVFCGISIQGQNVTAGAGAKLGQLITAAVSQGLAGLEEFIGVPGTVGGALRGNTEAYCGSGIGQWVESVAVADFDGNRSVLSRSSVSLGNQPNGLESRLILSAVFRLEKEDAVLLSKRMQKNWIVRKSRQPTGEAASACAFVNPVPGGVFAAELVEQNGLKGMKIGGVSVSERNAAFILAEPEATVSDVLRLLKLVQEQVSKRTDIELETSIEYWK
jgi:UDP-N-acetylmuramate dehydrogenase